MKAVVFLSTLLLSSAALSDTIEGHWKLTEAADLCADGSIARYPWGKHPIGSIVVQDGSRYLQIMSSDVPESSAGKVAIDRQMKAALLSTYIT